MKIKTGDQVIVLSGNHKGKIGIVQKIFPKSNKVIITGINIVSKRIKSGNQSTHGKIIKTESPLHISKIAILDIKTGKPTRVGILIKEGKKLRLLKKSGEYLNTTIHQNKIS